MRSTNIRWQKAAILKKMKNHYINNHLTNLTIYTLYDVIPLKGVPIGSHINITLHFVGHIFQNPHFWGMNRCFQVEHRKYSNFRTIKTIAAIQTKFGTIKNTKNYFLWVDPKCAPQIQHGGHFGTSDLQNGVKY